MSELDKAISKQQAEHQQSEAMDPNPDFCRIIQSEMIGQILLMIDTSKVNRNMVEVSVFFSHPDYGVVSLALNYHATNEGIMQAETMFRTLDAEKVHSLLAEQLAQLGFDTTKH